MFEKSWPEGKFDIFYSMVNTKSNANKFLEHKAKKWEILTREESLPFLSSVCGKVPYKMGGSLQKPGNTKKRQNIVSNAK